ncbi:ABC transporter ATP-binding protein [Bacillus timonensis]|uniref:ABC transporter ATP-binding protein n=1 Tax=Bacillus timonensis TaxID=1033734 RepID=UPI0002892619|nr:ABC transporter ATP-binding protein [Bacillus timonensis]
MKQLLDVQQLKVDFVTKSGYLTAIREITMDIKVGETVCIVGESGSGKTVASKTIMRLIDYENGQITGGNIDFNGTDLAKLSQKNLRAIRGKKIAMIFQEPMAAFDPVFTIGSQIIEMILAHKDTTKAKATEHAVYLLNRVGIPEPQLRLKQYPNELSGGMLQRAMIAMALACGPELLIADEPTTALDVTIQAQILQLLQELKDEFGMSILLITHDMGIAAEVADRIIVMYSGSIVEEATINQLFEKPHHPYTRGLLQSIPKLDSDRTQKLFSIDGSIPSLSNLPTGCSFHPRCSFATDKCKQENPPLLDVNGRRTACWFAEDLVEREEWLQQTTPSMEISEQPIFVEKKLGTDAVNSDSSPIFEVHGIKKYYPVGSSFLNRSPKFVRAVDDVSFTIEKGETFGLVGESGSGKSTLGRLLLQLEKVTEGNVKFEGKDLAEMGRKELQETRRHMQMIYQDPYGSVNPRWKIGDIIGEPLTVHESLSKHEKRKRVEELLQVVGLNANAYERYPHEFSGGQRQRIAIARAIALNPKFVLADEAVSALDVSVQAQIVNLMQDLQRNLGLTYLFIAHGLNVVRYISTRIGVMYLGKVVEIASSEELFRHPAHHYTKGLLESIPVANPSERRELSAIQGEIPSPANPPSGCRFHTRCPAATERCKQEEPAFREISKGHWVACHDPAYTY